MEHIISAIREGEETRERSMDGDPNLVFDIGDILLPNNNMLSKLVRLICYRERVTHGMLKNALRETIGRRGIPESGLTYAKPNLMKAIKADKVTFEKAIELFQQVLGYNVDISITLSKPGMTPRKYEFSTIMRDIAETINQKGKDT